MRRHGIRDALALDAEFTHQGSGRSRELARAPQRNNPNSGCEVHARLTRFARLRRATPKDPALGADSPLGRDPGVQRHPDDSVVHASRPAPRSGAGLKTGGPLPAPSGPSAVPARCAVLAGGECAERRATAEPGSTPHRCAARSGAGVNTGVPGPAHDPLSWGPAPALFRRRRRGPRARRTTDAPGRASRQATRCTRGRLTRPGPSRRHATR